VTADGFDSIYIAHNTLVLYGLTLAIAYTSIEAEQSLARTGEVGPSDPLRVTPPEGATPLYPAVRS
jgi:hypothetical protein